MRIPALSLAASLILLGAPAFAQSTPHAGAGQNASGNSTAATANSSDAGMSGGGVSMDTQQKIRHSLEQSGFKNVQVIPAAFLIRAQAPDGSRIVMEVTPDQVEGVVEHMPATGSSSGGNQSGHQSGTSSGNNSTGR